MDLEIGSVCTGIGAPEVAWMPLGWKPLWFAEIEAFPSAVLAHHYPSVPNLGDMTMIAAKVLTRAVPAPDVLVGGTPCQAFSVAGMRLGLSDERGALTLKFVELANANDHVRRAAGKPECIVTWENVPGVLSSKDNAFGCFLGALAGSGCELHPSGGRWADAGCVYGPQRAIAWRVLDAQYFGLAQRRRRVFVVASSRKGFDPAAVLFEREGLRRNSPPRREAGQGVTCSAEGIAGTVTSKWSKGTGGPSGDEHYNLIANQPTADVCGTLTSVGGRAVPGNSVQDAVVHQLVPVALSVALRGRDGGATAELGDDAAGCLRASSGGGDKPHVLSFHVTQDPISGDIAPTMGAGNSQGCGTIGAVVGSAVRRLTPRECERLQGFPDDYTAIPWRGKSADQCPDGPRYKALGNSMAVPVMRWIGCRIEEYLRSQVAA